MEPTDGTTSQARTISVIVRPPTSTAFPEHHVQQTNGHMQSAPSPASQPPVQTSAKRNGVLLFGLGVVAGQNRMSYPREFKLTAIKYFYENGCNKYRTCKEFQITKSMLNGWLQKIDKIQQSRPGSLKSGRSGRKPQFPTVEKELYEIYTAHLKGGNKVGNRWLRETAKLIAQRTCHPNELNGMCQFSERWLCNFKKRYNINLSKDWNRPSQDTKLVDSQTVGAKAEPKQPDDQAKHKTKSQWLQTAQPPQGSPEATDSCTSECSEPCLRRETTRRGRKVQFPQVEQLLNRLLCERQLDGERVTNRWLQDEAKRLAIELCPQTFHEAYKSARCMFSEHWLHNFKKRYGITLKQDAKTNSGTNNASTQLPLASSTDDGPKDVFCYRTMLQHIDDLPTMVPMDKSSVLSINVQNLYMSLKESQPGADA